MRETRNLASWVIGLFLAAMLVWAAVDLLAPLKGVKNHLFEVFAATSGIAYFEPTGRFVFGGFAVLAALLILIPPTRRIGAILSFLLTLGLAALLVQMMMQGITVPVDSVGANGAVTTAETDASALFYLTLGLLIASVVLMVIHPGKDTSDAGGSARGHYSAA